MVLRYFERKIDFFVNTPYSTVYNGGYNPMPQIQTMSLDEKLTIGLKSFELEKQGKKEEAEKLRKSIPLQPYLAKFIKDYIGLDALQKSGWNLSEAEAEYGTEWIIK
jgi:hypothetical protein